MAKKQKRIGRVVLSMGYVVDLDNESMVQEAKDCLFEDICNMVKYNEEMENITVVEDNTLTEKDIPEFLVELDNL